MSKIEWYVDWGCIEQKKYGIFRILDSKDNKVISICHIYIKDEELRTYIYKLYPNPGELTYMANGYARIRPEQGLVDTIKEVIQIDMQLLELQSDFIESWECPRNEQSN